VPSLVVSETTDTQADILTLEGELDVSTLRMLQGRLLDLAAAPERRCVVLDGMELTFIDSSGMRLLLSALRMVGRRGGCLTIACANPTVLRLFAVTGMDRTFVIRPSRAEAIEAARALAT
jgi:anti-sigma B factor antagonist